MTAQGRAETISALILTRNEAANLERLLPPVSRILQETGLEHSIVVVDAASEDGTADVAGRLGARVVQQSARGYGTAFRQGLAACDGDFILTLDADHSHRPEIILDLLAKRHRHEIVIASRYIEGGSAEMPRSRRVLSLVLNRVFGLTLGLRVSDLSSGFRLYSRPAVTGLELRGAHFDVLVEIVAMSIFRGCRVCEVPFAYQPREAGVSKARVIKFCPSYVRTLLRCLRARWRSSSR